MVLRNSRKAENMKVETDITGGSSVIIGSKSPSSEIQNIINKGKLKANN